MCLLTRNVMYGDVFIDTTFYISTRRYVYSHDTPYEFTRRCVYWHDVLLINTELCPLTRNYTYWHNIDTTFYMLIRTYVCLLTRHITNLHGNVSIDTTFYEFTRRCVYRHDILHIDTDFWIFFWIIAHCHGTAVVAWRAEIYLLTRNYTY